MVGPAIAAGGQRAARPSGVRTAGRGQPRARGRASAGRQLPLYPRRATPLPRSGRAATLHLRVGKFIRGQTLICLTRFGLAAQGGARCSLAAARAAKSPRARFGPSRALRVEGARSGAAAEGEKQMFTGTPSYIHITSAYVGARDRSRTPTATPARVRACWCVCARWPDLSWLRLQADTQFSPVPGRDSRRAPRQETGKGSPTATASNAATPGDASRRPRRAITFDKACGSRGGGGPRCC